MSSNYNTRGRAAEVMVSGDQAYLIRERETIESLWEKERLLPETFHFYKAGILHVCHD